MENILVKEFVIIIHKKQLKREEKKDLILEVDVYDNYIISFFLIYNSHHNKLSHGPENK